jgi:hypothetical protein
MMAADSYYETACDNTTPTAHRCSIFLPFKLNSNKQGTLTTIIHRTC